jgi:alcohol dehydrogenase (cytochrome c)
MIPVEPSGLALFWIGVIALSIMLYVILDGFDLGVGILFSIAENQDRRDGMLAPISPFWDGNETWLVVVGASLFAAFPVAYSVFLPAFYLPVLLMLFGLIVRGVGFEFRYRGASKYWDGGFCVGSVVVAFVQGAAVGAMIHGISMTDGQYTGDPFEWLAPLPVLTGIGLVLGYALLGACWLVMKSGGELQEWARERIPWLAIGVLAILVLAFCSALLHREQIGADLADRRWGLVFPGLGLLAMAGVFIGAREHRDGMPFAMAVSFFVAAFLTLAVLFWPYMIPYQVTVADAAAPDKALSFLFWGAGVFVLPVILIYTAVVYWVFRGKQHQPEPKRTVTDTIRRGTTMGRKLEIIVVALVALGAAGVGAGAALYFAFPAQVTIAGGEVRNYLLSLNPPPGTLQTETNAAYKDPPTPAVAAGTVPATLSGDWPSYNKTLTSERFSDLGQINTRNVSKLKVLCTFDTKEFTAFEDGLIMVNGALIGTTEFDIFSIDPATCALNWRTHENYPGYELPVNRGPAYLDGLLYRGTEDGRVLAYDFKTGKRVWETTIADANKGETVPAAPIAWNGLVFVGNAGGDVKGGKGRMYALDAKSGKVVWEFYLVPKTAGDSARGPQGASPLNEATWKNIPGAPISGAGTWTSTSLDPARGLLYVPGGNPAPDYNNSVRAGANFYSDSVVVLDAKTGAYKNHFQIVPKDWHDWDVSNPPALIHTSGGKRLMAVSPKDGFLYGFDLADNKLLYRTPATTMDNGDQPFSTGKDVHFCPGAAGGDEWNSPAYDPRTNLIYVGDVDWCTTVRMQNSEEIASSPKGQWWTGEKSINPVNMFGEFSRPDGYWSGWLHAVDADTGVWKWRLKSNYPIVAAVTPTAGGLVFFGDVGGNFYAVDAANGQKLWGQKLGAAIAGGVITYTVNGEQKVAVATGLTSPAWPVQVEKAKVVILGIENNGKTQ